MWKGTPVIGSNTGGIPLQVIDGKTGYLVEPEDIKGCAEKVLNILKKPDQAKKIAEAGREHVRRNFLITRLLSDYIDLVTELIG